MRRTSSILAALAAVAVAAGCGGGKEAATTTAPSSAAATIELSSPAFAAGATLPERYTCQGEGAAPPLRWSGVPSTARELALVVDDPDAPSGDFVHWIVLALAPATRDLPAGTKPATLRLGMASSGKVGYEPPCPPKGAKPHRYVFTLYALRAPLELPQGAAATTVRRAIAAKAIARGTLVARFARLG